MVDTPPGQTYAEIAAQYGRADTTIRNQWARHPDWPKPLPEKRGRFAQFDPAAVTRFVAKHVDSKVIDLEPRRLYTAREIEQLTGVTTGTIRADRSRGRWPAPDDRSSRAHRWYGATVTKALAGRRGYRQDDTDEQSAAAI
ncbi:hypothetical protein ME763_32135 [Streptomyces murinus]|uniref:helix-turn-helix transcriptional regulator n=1 Tax=Streptomyces murinus TaxID=33900 RepID=UPI000A1DBFBC|nr:hypothetical protein [Streptomyces murinus]WDO09940.1 hypothetical protein ME763_32135 [Streptomyces murinus]